MDTGTAATLRTRARLYADGKVFITEQRLALHFAFSAKGMAA